MKTHRKPEVAPDQYECAERNRKLRKSLLAFALLGATPGYTWSLAEKSALGALLVTAYLLAFFAAYRIFKVKKTKRSVMLR